METLGGKDVIQLEDGRVVEFGGRFLRSAPAESRVPDAEEKIDLN